MADAVAGFKPSTARRILKALNLTGVVPGVADDPFPDEGPRTAIAYTHSGTITARSGTTVGTGVAKLARIGASDVLEYVKDSTNADIVVTVKNTSTTAIAASQYIQIKRDYYSGFWLVDVGECA